MDEDKTHIEVESTIAYLKLKKIKRMILENQNDLEKTHTKQEFEILKKTQEHLNKMETEMIEVVKTHEHLKQLEMGITNKLGTTIIK
jgi:DNA primase